jgi:hypothetical protein
VIWLLFLVALMASMPPLTVLLSQTTKQQSLFLQAESIACTQAATHQYSRKLSNGVP